MDRGSTSTNSAPTPQPGPSGTARMRARSSVAVSSPPAASTEGFNVSININLPGPSHSRTERRNRRNRSYRHLSDTDTSSGSDLSPVHKKPPRKMPKKITQPVIKSKRKTLLIKKPTENTSQKEKTVVKNKPNSNNVGRPCSAGPPIKRRRQPAALNSSSDDEPSVLQIDTEPDLLELVGPESPENEPRLKSVVVKPEIKKETLDESDLPSSYDSPMSDLPSYRDTPNAKTENKYFAKEHETSDSESSDSSCHGSYRRLSKIRNFSKKKKNLKNLITFK